MKDINKLIKGRSSFIYNPPYDSPIENEFAYHLEKYIDPSVIVIPQYEIKTLCGTFRPDFFLRTNTTKIVIECDGKEFHSAYRDEWRDAMILGDSDIDAIYRITGAGIVYHLMDVFYIISKLDKNIFSERGRKNIKSLVSKEIKNFEPSKNETIFYLSGEGGFEYKLIKHHKNIPKGRRQFWQSLYKYAKNKDGGNLDSLIEQYNFERVKVNW